MSTNGEMARTCAASGFSGTSAGVCLLTTQRLCSTTYCEMRLAHGADSLFSVLDYFCLFVKFLTHRVVLEVLLIVLEIYIRFFCLSPPARVSLPWLMYGFAWLYLAIRVYIMHSRYHLPFNADSSTAVTFVFQPASCGRGRSIAAKCSAGDGKRTGAILTMSGCN